MAKKPNRPYAVFTWRSKDGWRWHMTSPNGRIVAESGEAYSSKGACAAAIKRLFLVVLTKDITQLSEEY